MKRTVSNQKAHKNEIFTIDFSFDHEFLFLTGGEGGIIKLWDLRNLNKELYQFSNEGKSVLNINWSPTIPGIFASAGED